MASDEYRVSEESRPLLEPYASLPLGDPGRIDVFSFLVEAVIEPDAVVFEEDEGLRWTWLEHDVWDLEPEDT